MNLIPDPRPLDRAGLCATCRHARRVTTKRGSAFVLCERSRTDSTFPRYPPLPVRACRGYELDDGADARDHPAVETPPSTVAVRDALPTDAAAIARIYNEGIEDRIATLETTLRTPAERAEWLAARSPRHPVLVAADDTGSVLGWGSLNPFNPRPVYEHVADFSIYVAREQRGRGIGSALLAALIERARATGYHKMVLAALAANRIGRRLYERHGFSVVGVYHEQGLLDGRWIDVVAMERLL